MHFHLSMWERFRAVLLLILANDPWQSLIVTEHNFIIHLIVYAVVFFSNANDVTVIIPHSSAHKHIVCEGWEDT